MSALAPTELRGVLVSATDTGVGKTMLAASLAAAMRAAGHEVRVHKPVLTGLEDPGVPDHELLARATGMPAAQIVPLRYGPPVSPHLATELAGEPPLDPERVLAAARAAATGAGGSGANGAADSTLIVEGVGGLLTPLTLGYTVCDLAAELGLPLLLAARPGLGTINHTLLTLQAARAADLAVRGVVLTPWPAQPTRVELSNRETIARMGRVSVSVLARVGEPTFSELARVGAALPWRRWIGAPPHGDAAHARAPRSLAA